MKETYPAGYATTPVEGAHASPALLGTVRPKTLSSLTWKKTEAFKTLAKNASHRRRRRERREMESLKWTVFLERQIYGRIVENVVSQRANTAKPFCHNRQTEFQN